MEEVRPSLFPQMCGNLGLPQPIPEYLFHPERKWRVDFAFVGQKLALEIEGAVWKQGRHTRGSGFLADIEKYNALAILGWRLVRCTPKEMKNGEVFNLIERALGRKL